MLVHGSLEHLISNLVLQLVFGILLELSQGYRRVAVVHISSSLGGLILHLIQRPGRGLHGASAAVFGLFAGNISSQILNWRDTESSLKNLYVFALLICTEVFFALNESVTGISQAAHLGGGIVGFLIGIVVLEGTNNNLPKKILRCFCKILSISLLIYSIYIIIEERRMIGI